MAAQAKAKADEPLVINTGLLAKPIEHSMSIGVVGGNRRGLGIGITAQTTHAAGLHHRAGALKPVKDLGCCHHVAVSRQTVRQAQHRLTELVDVGEENNSWVTAFGFGLGDMQPHQRAIHHQPLLLLGDLHGAMAKPS